LPTDEHKLSWAKGEKQVSLGQVDTTTPLTMQLDFGSLRPALHKSGARKAAPDAHKGPVNNLQGQLERESEQASDRKDREGGGGGGGLRPSTAVKKIRHATRSGATSVSDNEEPCVSGEKLRDSNDSCDETAMLLDEDDHPDLTVNPYWQVSFGCTC